MVSLNGLALIAHRELARRIMLGLVKLSMPTMLTHGLSAQTKVFAIAPQELVTASLDTKVSLVKELFVQITAMTEELVGQRKFWRRKRPELILLRGML